MAKKNLVIDNPKLMSSWDWEKNNAEGLFPSDFACGSRQEAWWICDKGHSYQSRIAHKKEGHMCPYCSGRLAIPGETDLATLYPSIASEWDYKKNCPTTPNIVKPMCNDLAWWICDKGHSYSSVIANRVSEGSGCPYCSNKKVLAGFNDLATLLPDLVVEWDYAANTISPSEITIGSNKEVYWICKRGHSYPASPSNRKRGRGCPYCSNKKLLVGFNDLATVFPEIASEWDYQKNVGETPQDYVYGSGASVHWKCRKGHEWEIPIINRTRDGNGCPICNKAKAVSFPEKALLYYIRKLYPDAISNFRSKEIHNREIDVFLKEYKIGIEYDGDIWHRDASRDNEKNYYCGQVGITLIRIREPECPILNGSSIDYSMKSHSTQEYNRGIVFAVQAVNNLTGKTGKVDVSIKRDTQKILKTMDIEEVEKSLACRNPELARDWHPTKNTILPTQVTANSGIEVYWLGKCGHEWPATIAARNKGEGCPICRGLTVLKGFNDLETLYPDIVKEWDYEKNSKKPSEITAKNNTSYFWKCKLGHEYPASPYDRVVKHNGCPYCSNHRVLAGFNDLQTTHPLLAEEWDYEKNSLLPTQVTAGKPEKVWWKCKECGYEWEAYISNRSRGSGCRECAKRKQKLSRPNRIKGNDVFLEDLKKRNAVFEPLEPYVNATTKIQFRCKKCGFIGSMSPTNMLNAKGCRNCQIIARQKIISKPVCCVETQKRYPSIKEASIATDISSSSIAACVKGNQQTAGGYHWVNAEAKTD